MGFLKVVFPGGGEIDPLPPPPPALIFQEELI